MQSRLSTVDSVLKSQRSNTPGSRQGTSHSSLPPVTRYSTGKSVESRIKVSEPWCLEYKYTEDSISFPKKLLFYDYLCSNPILILDLRGWILPVEAFEIIGRQCRVIRSLFLDDVLGLTEEGFEFLRGLKHLKKLSLQRIQKFPINKNAAQVISSLKSLRYLNLNECQTCTDAYVTFSQTLSCLRVLSLSKSTGLEDSGLHALGQMIQRFRVLEKVDFSYCSDFGNDGLLDFFVAGFQLLKEVNISYCRAISTTALAGLRTRMPQLKALNLSNMVMGNTIFEWLSEGCKDLTHLDISNSPELDDAALAKIGRWCRHLTVLNISKCQDVTDYGVKGFFKTFYGFLESIDFSGCNQLGTESALTLSEHASKLQIIKLNGLSKILPVGLTALWNSAPELQRYEMCSDLSTTSTHRRSTMPHLSDLVLTTAALPYNTLTDLKLIGAFQVTDVGACAIARTCLKLRSLDVSYCNGISDALLVELANHSCNLKVFIGTGCILITSAGIQALSQGRHVIEIVG
jgi:hypothetical protein